MFHPYIIDFMLIKISDYPQLQMIAFNKHQDNFIDDFAALTLYEENWRFIEQDDLNSYERDFIHTLFRKYNRGSLLF